MTPIRQSTTKQKALARTVGTSRTVATSKTVTTTAVTPNVAGTTASSTATPFRAVTTTKPTPMNIAAIKTITPIRIVGPIPTTDHTQGKTFKAIASKVVPILPRTNINSTPKNTSTTTVRTTGFVTPSSTVSAYTRTVAPSKNPVVTKTRNIASKAVVGSTVDSSMTNNATPNGQRSTTPTGNTPHTAKQKQKNPKKTVAAKPATQQANVAPFTLLLQAFNINVAAVLQKLNPGMQASTTPNKNSSETNNSANAPSGTSCNLQSGTKVVSKKPEGVTAQSLPQNESPMQTTYQSSKSIPPENLKTSSAEQLHPSSSASEHHSGVCSTASNSSLPNNDAESVAVESAAANNSTKSPQANKDNANEFRSPSRRKATTPRKKPSSLTAPASPYRTRKRPAKNANETPQPVGSRFSKEEGTPSKVNIDHPRHPPSIPPLPPTLTTLKGFRNILAMKEQLQRLASKIDAPPNAQPNAQPNVKKKQSLSSEKTASEGRSCSPGKTSSALNFSNDKTVNQEINTTKSINSQKTSNLRSTSSQDTLDSDSSVEVFRTDDNEELVVVHINPDARPVSSETQSQEETDEEQHTTRPRHEVKGSSLNPVSNRSNIDPFVKFSLYRKTPEYKLLSARFQSLFLWPILMSEAAMSGKLMPTTRHRMAQYNTSIKVSQGLGSSQAANSSHSTPNEKTAKKTNKGLSNKRPHKSKQNTKTPISAKRRRKAKDSDDSEDDHDADHILRHEDDDDDDYMPISHKPENVTPKRTLRPRKRNYKSALQVDSDLFGAPSTKKKSYMAEKEATMVLNTGATQEPHQSIPRTTSGDNTINESRLDNLGNKEQTVLAKDSTSNTSLPPTNGSTSVSIPTQEPRPSTITSSSVQIVDDTNDESIESSSVHLENETPSIRMIHTSLPGSPGSTTTQGAHHSSSSVSDCSRATKTALSTNAPSANIISKSHLTPSIQQACGPSTKIKQETHPSNLPTPHSSNELVPAGTSRSLSSSSEANAAETLLSLTDLLPNE